MYKQYVSCWGADADLEIPSAYVSLHEGNEEDLHGHTDDPDMKMVVVNRQGLKMMKVQVRKQHCARGVEATTQDFVQDRNLRHWEAVKIWQQHLTKYMEALMQ